MSHCACCNKIIESTNKYGHFALIHGDTGARIDVTHNRDTNSYRCSLCSPQTFKKKEVCEHILGVNQFLKYTGRSEDKLRQSGGGEGGES